MADVVEVIHKISYEVNDTSLQNVNVVILNQVRELKNLTEALRQFQQQLNSTRNITALDELGRKIEKVTRQIDSSVARSKGIIQEFSSGLLKGLGLDTDIESNVAKFFKPLGDHLFKVGEQGKGASGSIASIGQKLLSFSNVAPPAIGIAISLAKELYNMATAASEAEIAHANLIESLKQTAVDTKNNIWTQTGTIDFYKNLIDNATTPEIRRKFIDQLRKVFPAQLQNVKDEDFSNANASFVFAGLRTETVNAQRLKGYNEQYIKVYTEQKNLEGQIKSLERSIEIYNKKISELEGKSQLAKGERIAMQAFKDAIKEENRKIDSLNFQVNNIRALLKNSSKIAAKFSNPGSDFNSKSAELFGNTGSVRRNVSYAPKKIGKSTDNAIVLSNPSFEQESAAGLTMPSPEAPAPPDTSASDKLMAEIEQARKENSDKEKKAAEAAEAKRRDNINQSINAYKSLVETAVNAYQTITDAQLRALDKEIEIRQKRVDAATKLAERGNTEALRIEEERLAKAQKKREEIARRQQVVNAALAVSNAIVAIAEAASQSGVGALVTIPAVIAALVAGYAAVSSATKESGELAFADGVVGFKGIGGPRDDKNWVRISSGESVITAEGTAKNRALLEAINKGANINMLAPHINPLYQPHSGYTSRYEMRTLEGKMDALIDAVTANGTTVHANVDERGLSLMTVKQLKRDQNRFR